MRIALDTNVLAYAAGVTGDARGASAVALLRQLPEDAAVVPVQALGELYNVLVRKSGWPRNRARTAILSWRDAFAVAPTTEFAMIAAADLAADHRLGIWDSVMIAVAAGGAAGCCCRKTFKTAFRGAG